MKQLIKIKIIKDFVEEDSRGLLRVLVRNLDGKIEERCSCNQNYRHVLEPDDEEILAISEKDFYFESDICDNCDYDCENGCSKNLSKMDCAVDLIISERHDGFYDMILRNFKENFA